MKKHIFPISFLLLSSFIPSSVEANTPTRFDKGCHSQAVECAYTNPKTGEAGLYSFEVAHKGRAHGKKKFKPRYTICSRNQDSYGTIKYLLSYPQSLGQRELRKHKRYNHSADILCTWTSSQGNLETGSFATVGKCDIHLENLQAYNADCLSVFRF